MKITVGLAGLAIALISASASALTPSYDFIEGSFVRTERDANTHDNIGGTFKVSGLIAPYMYFNAGYEYLTTRSFNIGPTKGKLQTNMASAGLGGRLPLVLNMLDFSAGADFVYADIRGKGGFEDLVDAKNDSGYQLNASLRGNFKYFEAIPSIRYLSILEDESTIYGVQLLGYLGLGTCITAGYEYFDERKDHRYSVGLRVYFDD
jgi:hypothetical protein